MADTFILELGEKKMIQASAVRSISSHPLWVSSLYEFVSPYWDALVNGPWAQQVATPRLSVAQMRGWILQLYTFKNGHPTGTSAELIKGVVANLTEDDMVDISAYVGSLKP